MSFNFKKINSLAQLGAELGGGWNLPPFHGAVPETVNSKVISQMSSKARVVLICNLKIKFYIFIHFVSIFCVQWTIELKVENWKYFMLRKVSLPFINVISKIKTQ